MHPNPNRKIERVNAALKRDIGDLITTWLVDPRLAKLISVSRVETARDLGNATVYVRVLGSEEERQDTMEALKSARTALRHVLKGRVRIRYVPRLTFKLDELDAADGGVRDVLSIIDEVAIQAAEADGGARDGQGDG